MTPHPPDDELVEAAEELLGRRALELATHVIDAEGRRALKAALKRAGGPVAGAMRSLAGYARGESAPKAPAALEMMLGIGVIFPSEVARVIQAARGRLWLEYRRPITTLDLASLCGVKTARVRAWVSDGTLTRNRNGEIFAAQAVSLMAERGMVISDER